ncbi:polycystic kidney disease 1 like 1-like, partial [Limulus polyphemus]|uniref:Polycystic kidney disease 1 like 1-like n=1 Tax=Limulus polyphemus TaxID=6850 RepID=A0ABM1TPD7_LIMPO
MKDPTIYYGLHNLQRIISQEGAAGDPKQLSFSSSQLRENINYVIIITATNRFGGESYLPSTHRVKRVTKPLALTLQGPNVVDAQHDITFTVFVDICGDLDMTTSNLQFTWSLFPPIIDLSRFIGTTATIPKGYLQLANTYNISVEVSVTNDQSQWSDVTQAIRVKKMNLQAVISSSNLVVGDKTPFKLDGALSSDPSNAAGELQFLWSCTDRMTSSSSCFEDNLLINDQILTLPAGVLLPNMYLITLKVFKGIRSSESHTLVTIRQGELPVVYVIKRKTGRINPDERLIVEGYVSSRANVTLRWEVVTEK